MSKKEDEHKEGKKKRKNMTRGGIMQKNEFLFVFISICQCQWVYAGKQIRIPFSYFWFM